MGNPHAVIEVDDVEAAAVALLGPALQSSAAFPQSANIGFAQVVGSSPTPLIRVAQLVRARYVIYRLLPCFKNKKNVVD